MTQEERWTCEIFQYKKGHFVSLYCAPVPFPASFDWACFAPCGKISDERGVKKKYKRERCREVKKRLRKFDPVLVFPKNQVCCLIPFVGLCSCVSLRM
jgi:hypothetical protein